MSRFGWLIRQTWWIRVATLDGGPAALVHAGPAGLIGAVFIEPADGDRAAVIRWVRNPDKLQRLC